MLYPWLTPLVAAIALLVLAFAVSRRSSEGELPQVFVFFAVVLCFWNLNFFVLYSVEDRDLLWELSRVLRTGTLFLPAAILHLFLAIDPKRPRSWRYILIGVYSVSIIFSLANTFDLLVLDLRHVGYGYVSDGGVGYNLYTIYAIINAIAALTVLIHYYRTSKEPRTRQQLAFWIAGSLFATPLVLTNLLPAYGISIYPPGNLGSAVWAGIIGYAIIRHRLLDIELVISRGLSFFIVALAFLVPLGFGLSGIQKYAFGVVDYNATAALLMLCIFASAGFSYAQAWIEGQFESSLLREKREARESLVSFGKEVVRMLDEPRIIQGLIEYISDAFQLENISFFSADDTDRDFQLRDWRGMSLPIDTIQREQFTDWFTALPTPVLKSEVPTLVAEPADRAAASNLFGRNKWELVIPLRVGAQTIGLLGLGQKPSSQPYTAADLMVLETLGAQASIAIENSRLHERLKRSREIIHRSDRLSALGTLAAGIAHEIRNPLVSIQTFFQLAPHRLGDEEFMNSFLKLAEKEVVRIRNLIGDLLSYAKASAPVISDVRPDDVIDRAIGLLAPHAGERKVQLVVDDLTSLPPIEADSDQLLQAILNIILNAIDAVAPGGHVSIHGYCVVEDGVGYSCVEIADTGPGIPPELLEAIFDPFFTTKEKGTGLGLAISHRIVGDLGGFVSVTSAVGEGSRFRVSLPIAQSTYQTEAKVAALGGR